MLNGNSSEIRYLCLMKWPRELIFGICSFTLFVLVLEQCASILCTKDKEAKITLILHWKWAIVFIVRLRQANGACWSSKGARSDSELNSLLCELVTKSGQKAWGLPGIELSNSAAGAYLPSLMFDKGRKLAYFGCRYI